MKRIIVSVTNDFTTDQRVAKICDTLLEMDYQVTLVGRMLRHSQNINREYKTKRFTLLFNRGPMFYACFNIRLFIYLLFSKFDVLWSNDLDTLPANYLVSIIRSKKIIFDSHEYFTEVPELQNKPAVKKIWKGIEKWILPKLKHVFTVSPSIIDIYKEEYGVDAKLLRNVPKKVTEIKREKTIKIKGKNTIIYQGAININRGIEYMVEAMQYLDETVMFIAGKGDIEEKISKMITELQLEDKVIMLGEIPWESLMSYTVQADVGLSLEEDVGLNYRFALPNKLFNYIHANIPVLASNLPEMKSIIEKYQIGEIIEVHNAQHIAKKISSLLNNRSKMNFWKKNTKKAAMELNWDIEKQIIKTVL